MASHGTCMGTEAPIAQTRFPMTWVIGLCTRSGSRRPIGCIGRRVDGMRLIRRVASSGFTSICSTHDLIAEALDDVHVFISHL